MEEEDIFVLSGTVDLFSDEAVKKDILLQMKNNAFSHLSFDTPTVKTVEFFLRNPVALQYSPYHLSPSVGSGPHTAEAAYACVPTLSLFRAEYCPWISGLSFHTGVLLATTRLRFGRRPDNGSCPEPV